MKITLLITSLNEIEGMKVICPRIQKDWVDEIMVIDGNSTDGSFEYAESLGYRVVRQKSKGLAKGYAEAVPLAIGDVIIPFSPDGNSVPERIPELVKKMREGYDMVIVSRYLDGAKSEDDNWFTGFGNWMFTTTINLLFGGHYTDTLVMFRAWKKELVRECQLEASTAGFEPQLAIQCAKRNLKVGEIPGDEPNRIHGIRKTNPIAGGFSILWLIIKEFFTPVQPAHRPEAESEAAKQSLET